MGHFRWHSATPRAQRLLIKPASPSKAIACETNACLFRMLRMFVSNAPSVVNVPTWASAVLQSAFFGGEFAHNPRSHLPWRAKMSSSRSYCYIIHTRPTPVYVQSQHQKGGLVFFNSAAGSHAKQGGSRTKSKGGAFCHKLRKLRNSPRGDFRQKAIPAAISPDSLPIAAFRLFAPTMSPDAQSCGGPEISLSQQSCQARGWILGGRPMAKFDVQNPTHLPDITPRVPLVEPLYFDCTCLYHAWYRTPSLPDVRRHPHTHARSHPRIVRMCETKHAIC